MRVQRIDERLASFNLPPVTRVGHIPVSRGDCIIVCAGFEDRSLAVLRSLTDVSAGLPSVVLIEYRPIVGPNHVDDCLVECARLGITPSRFCYDRENPAGAAQELCLHLRTTPGRVYVDISGMSRLLIVQFLSESISHDYFRRLTVLYVEAEHYHPSEEECAQRGIGSPASTPIQFLSWGVSQITVVPELTSIALEDQPTHLIAFPTFDPQQLSAVRKDVEPSVMTVIHGRPLPAHGDWRMRVIRALNGLPMATACAEDFASTYDYTETMTILLQLYAGAGRQQRIVISPTGSKMQTVAVGLVRAFLRDVTIVYPTPTFFKTDAYTTGARQVHRLDLDAFVELVDTADLELQTTNPLSLAG